MERPILFSAPMVRALLAGTKTQTRRGVKGWRTADGSDDFAPPLSACAYGASGDRLRVKEAAWMWCERRPNGTTKTGRQKWRYVPMRSAGIWYAADHRTKPNIGVVSPDTGNEWGWRLKIGRFLPAWASRITLEVTEVRVERLNSISVSDCIAEGIPRGGPENPDGIEKREYRALWESINGLGSWDANPWVWAVSFRRVA